MNLLKYIMELGLNIMDLLTDIKKVKNTEYR